MGKKERRGDGEVGRQQETEGITVGCRVIDKGIAI